MPERSVKREKFSTVDDIVVIKVQNVRNLIKNQLESIAVYEHFDVTEKNQKITWLTSLLFYIK